MRRRRWTDGDMLALARMLGEGDGHEDIAIVMDRTVDEVLRRAVALGLVTASADGRARGAKWTQDERRTLSDMWLAGRSSSEIAANLKGRTRDAVMGMVNRLGLMGRARSGAQAAALDFHSVYMTALDHLKPLGRDETLMWNADGSDLVATHHLLDIHGDVAFLMTVILHGRDPAAIALAYEVTEAEAATRLRRLNDTGLWRDGEPRPVHWNQVARTPQILIMDAMVLRGLMDVSGFNGSPRYRLPYSDRAQVAAPTTDPDVPTRPRRSRARAAPFFRGSMTKTRAEERKIHRRGRKAGKKPVPPAGRGTGASGDQAKAIRCPRSRTNAAATASAMDTPSAAVEQTKVCGLPPVTAIRRDAAIVQADRRPQRMRNADMTGVLAPERSLQATRPIIAGRPTNTAAIESDAPTVKPSPINLSIAGRNMASAATAVATDRRWKQRERRRSSSVMVVIVLAVTGWIQRGS